MCYNDSVKGKNKSRQEGMMINMSFKIGFTSNIGKENERKEEVALASENTAPKRSVVEVRFPGRGIDHSYYNDKFDLKIGDLVYVDGKLEGKLGRVVGVNCNFKIKLSDYKRVIAVVNTDIHGTFYNAITHFISFEPEALPYSKAVTWFKAPEKDEEEFVSGSDGSGFSLSNLSEMNIDPTIAERGHDYYLQNYVKYLSLNGTHGRAVVVGGEAYELEFEYEDGNIKNLTCSCYCSFNCKHEFAAMLQLKDTLDYIEKNYVKEFERTHFFALIDKSKFFSFAVDGKEGGSFTI